MNTNERGEKMTTTTKTTVDVDRDQSAIFRGRVWQSEQLLCGDREILIVHGEETYRLRHTCNGKLILQK